MERDGVFGDTVTRIWKSAEESRYLVVARDSRTEFRTGHHA